MPKYLPEPRATSRYMHHGKIVSVIDDVAGKHRSVCLCHNFCKHFNPGQPDNCEIAELVFRVDVLTGITTPVFECPEYEMVEPDD